MSLRRRHSVCTDNPWREALFSSGGFGRDLFRGGAAEDGRPASLTRLDGATLGVHVNRMLNAPPEVANAFFADPSHASFQALPSGLSDGSEFTELLNEWRNNEPSNRRRTSLSARQRKRASDSVLHVREAAAAATFARRGDMPSQERPSRRVRRRSSEEDASKHESAARAVAAEAAAVEAQDNDNDSDDEGGTETKDELFDGNSPAQAMERSPAQGRRIRFAEESEDSTEEAQAAHEAQDEQPHEPEHTREDEPTEAEKEKADEEDEPMPQHFIMHREGSNMSLMSYDEQMELSDFDEDMETSEDEPTEEPWQHPARDSSATHQGQRSSDETRPASGHAVRFGESAATAAATAPSASVKPLRSILVNSDRYMPHRKLEGIDERRKGSPPTSAKISQTTSFDNLPSPKASSEPGENHSAPTTGTTVTPITPATPDLIVTRPGHAVSFLKLANVKHVRNTFYPTPVEHRKAYPSSVPATRSAAPAPVHLTPQQQHDVLKKLRQLLKKHQLTYADLLRLAVGKFSLSEDLPEYLEDFMYWVMKYRSTDPVTGEQIKLNWMDRSWLKPVVEEIWGVHHKYSHSLYL